jgi:putative DNA primase/helicase
MDALTDFNDLAGAEGPETVSSQIHNEVAAASKRKRKHKASDRPAGDSEVLRRYVIVYGSEVIWDADLLIPMRPPALRLAIGADAYKQWAANPDRRILQPSQIVFDPTGTCEPDCINLFKGLAMQPAAGDVSQLLELLSHLVAESADTKEGADLVLQFVLHWLAYPLQHPGAKMATAMVFHGPQGTGKNLFFEACAQIYGDYAAVIGQAQLESRYNDWASEKLFIIGDEIVASGEQTHYGNKIKALITGSSIHVEVKFMPVRVQKNSANFVFLSNENRPLALERDDRRYLVVYCPPKRLDGLYERVQASIESGAVTAFYDYLLKLDLGSFHAHTLPPATKAKSELIELGLRPAERFAREWLSKEIDLPFVPCSTNQLYRAFTSWCRRNGDRMPPNQANFSSTVMRYAHNKLSRKTASPSPLEGGASIVLWLPKGTGPLDGVRWIDFAKDCCAMFESPLSRFCSNFKDDQP